MVQQSRAQGVLKGTATGSLRLTLIRTDQTVEVGNTVVTSGLGGVFPKGLPLGKVVSVEIDPSYGNATYYISADGTTETQLEAMLEARDAYVSDLAHGNRRERQRAAHGLNLLAQEDVAVVQEEILLLQSEAKSSKKKF